MRYRHAFQKCSTTAGLLVALCALSAFATGCANVAGISGYDNVDDPDASSPDVGGDAADTAVPSDTGTADASDTSILADADAADTAIPGDADASDTPALNANGVACSTKAECTSGNCVDGVCCNTACGAGDPTDCQACSAANGGTAADGTCSPRAATVVCRAAAGTCDVAEKCDGAGMTCPADAKAGVGTSCAPGSCSGSMAVAASTCNGVGSCVAGATTICSAGCAGTVCAGDPCAGVTCSTPPASTCVDASTRKTYGSTGTCAGGTCTYAPTTTACPAASCSGGVATTASTCAGAGVCQPGTNTTCTFGCSGTVCAADPCAGVTCSAPQAPTCTDSSTRRTYASTGTCASGTCSYLPTDTACAAISTCSGTACTAATQIAAGFEHTCVANTGGSVKCWGNNLGGNLGDGTRLDHRMPTAVVGLAAVSSIALGGGGTGLDSHGCAVLTDGTVKCWGNNAHGQIGDGTTTDRLTPVVVPGLSAVAQVGAGWMFTCARLTSGTVSCWGSNAAGNVGDGTTTDRWTPKAIAGLSGVTQIAVGYGHACALLTGGSVKCWGWNNQGQIGDGTIGPNRPTPTSLVGLSNVASIAAGYNHTCARLTDGTAKCWGWNGQGQLGDGTTTDHYAPQPVPGLASVAELALGGDHTCARRTDGTVTCWGQNDAGQLGDGTTTFHYSPTVVTGLAGVSQIACGGYHTCALLGDGTIRCFGLNGNGQLGDATPFNRTTPTLVGSTPSCLGGGDGRFNCGLAGNEDCCGSPLVAGGTFSRSYDGVTTGYTDPQYKATISDFRLDKYEVTVGRYRQFVNAVVAGWTPPAGAGKHFQLNGGSGLLAAGGGYESGWNSAWNTTANLPKAKATWDGVGYLSCNGADPPSWTAAAGAREKLPINCLSWYQAQAFCIWDGGFMPSEAEWNYAAAGGTEQRVYPWGSTTPGSNASLAAYGCFYGGTGTCSGVSNIAAVGLIPAGAGKWGQRDLAGNVAEWLLDWNATPYPDTTCVNCTNATAATYRVWRGGAYNSPATTLTASARATMVGTPAGIGAWLGVRCARGS